MAAQSISIISGSKRRIIVMAKITPRHDVAWRKGSGMAALASGTLQRLSSEIVGSISGSKNKWQMNNGVTAWRCLRSGVLM